MPCPPGLAQPEIELRHYGSLTLRLSEDLRDFAENYPSMECRVEFSKSGRRLWGEASQYRLRFLYPEAEGGAWLGVYITAEGKKPNTVVRAACRNRQSLSVCYDGDGNPIGSLHYNESRDGYFFNPDGE